MVLVHSNRRIVVRGSIHGTGRGAKADTRGGSGVAVRRGISRVMVCNCRLILSRCLRHGAFQPATLFRGRHTVARRRMEYGSSGVCAVDAQSRCSGDFGIVSHKCQPIADQIPVSLQFVCKYSAQ